jgi:hypothetical protein
MATIRSEDTYQAAWFLMKGGEFVGFEKRFVKAGKGIKFGIHKKWIINMINVPEAAVEEWKNGMAEGKIREFADARRKLKRLVKNYENRYSR